MTKPSRDICEVSSVHSCDERTGAFSHHSDARPVREVQCCMLANDGNLPKKRPDQAF